LIFVGIKLSIIYVEVCQLSPDKKRLFFSAHARETEVADSMATYFRWNFTHVDVAYHFRGCEWAISAEQQQQQQQHPASRHCPHPQMLSS